jgi:hypothetical protein
LPGINGARVGVEDHRRFARDRLVGRLAVAHHQYVVVFRMLEEKADARFFHQAADEIQLGLLILDAVCSGRIAPQQREPLVQACKARVFEHLLDDLFGVQMLEYPSVVTVAKIPDPGHEGSVVNGEAFALISLFQVADHGMQIAGFITTVEGQQRRWVDDLLELERRVFRGQLQLQLKLEHEGL